MKRASFITWEQLKVGALIVVALAILSIAAVRLGQAANLFTKRYDLVAFLPNANGLREGGQVTVAGQLAGTIKKIDFLPPDADTTRNLRVTLQVDQQLSDQIRADSKAKVRTQGLLGDKVLDISPGTPRYDRLKAGDTIELTTPIGGCVYQVTKAPFPVDPSDLSVLDPTADRTVTLTTCHPKGSAAQRLIVKGTWVKNLPAA